MKDRGRTPLTLWVLVVLLAVTSTVIIQPLSMAVRRSASAPTDHCQPDRTAAHTVQVILDDGGTMMGPSPSMVRLTPTPRSTTAGPVTFIVTNSGQLTHELLVFPLVAGGVGTRTVGADGRIVESSILGEASKSCANGAGSGIIPGSRSWSTIDLRPGTYELLCDVPWHYAYGMYSTFTVT